MPSIPSNTAFREKDIVLFRSEEAFYEVIEVDSVNERAKVESSDRSPFYIGFEFLALVCKKEARVDLLSP